MGRFDVLRRIEHLDPERDFAEIYFARQLPQVRSYPDGYRVADLGTFPSACPVPRPRAGARAGAPEHS